MTLGVTFALGSLLAAAVLDIVFRLYSVKPRSRGMYVFLGGIVWALLQGAAIGLRGTDPNIGGDTMLVGLLAGLLIALANLLFIESLGRINVSLASTIYRLNTIVVVALAVLLFDEAITLPKLLGITLGALAVLTLYDPGKGTGAAPLFHFFFFIAVTASVLRALWGIVLKAGSVGALDPQVIMLMSALGFVAVGGVYAGVWERRFQLTRATIGYSSLTGLLLFLVANLLMLAIENGEASVVVPIANMSFLGAIALSAMLGMEALTIRKGVSIGLASGAILALALAG